jgi:hypothetical protein
MARNTKPVEQEDIFDTDTFQQFICVLHEVIEGYASVYKQRFLTGLDDIVNDTYLNNITQRRSRRDRDEERDDSGRRRYRFESDDATEYLRLDQEPVHVLLEQLLDLVAFRNNILIAVKKNNLDLFKGIHSGGAALAHRGEYRKI